MTSTQITAPNAPTQTECETFGHIFARSTDPNTAHLLTCSECGHTARVIRPRAY
jgi:hypothetical protein